MVFGAIANLCATVLFGWCVMAIVALPAVWMVLKRLGLRPAMSLLFVVPLLGFLVIGFYVAFASWPRGDAVRP